MENHHSVAPSTLPLYIGAVEAEHVAGMLSRNTRFRLLAAGPFGLREMRQLVRLLSAQIEVLTDTENRAMEDMTIPAGTLIHLNGVPFTLKTDAVVLGQPEAVELARPFVTPPTLEQPRD